MRSVGGTTDIALRVNAHTKREIGSVKKDMQKEIKSAQEHMKKEIESAQKHMSDQISELMISCSR